MAYRHYETEGLIIGHRNLGEANRLYQVLTYDLGLINVLAQSVRKDQSKLRHHLQIFSFTRLVLVRGREFWRAVGVSDLGSLAKPSKITLPFLKKISLVLLRLIHGEVSSPLVYQDLKQASILILEQGNQGEGGDRANLEIFVLTRLLSELGYLELLPELREEFLRPDFSWPEVGRVKDHKSLLVRRINQALESTQL
jgi:recombinational DNA repair protein (RecF pathway)